MSGTLSPGAPARSDARHVRTRDEMWASLAKAALDRAAEADGADALAWVERARRIAPTDATIALTLALASLGNGQLQRAAALFQEVLRQFDLAEAWSGLATCAYRLKDHGAAARAIQTALSRACTPTILHPLAAAIAEAAHAPGWCAAGSDGWLQADAPAELTMDGARLRPRWTGARCRLPAPDRRGRTLHVMRGGRHLLGSPMDLAAMAIVEGFVQADRGGLSGWGWFPNDPARDPVFTVTGSAGAMAISAREGRGILSTRPLARPRAFAVAAAVLPPGLLHVTGPGGRDLLGSPLDPGLEIRAAAGLADGFQPVWADVTGPAPAIVTRRRKVDVVVPVYGAITQTLACLDAVLATLPRGSRLIVVDDAGPDQALAEALDRLARRAAVRLIRHPVNRGFPAAANAGLQAAAGHDAVLLNSDTIVPPGWLEALTDAAYSAPHIGTVSPLSNEATILSYPRRHGGNPMPDAAAMADLARRASGGAVVDIPVAIGFCMLIRRDCLDHVGSFREDLFAQGYGEENDFCLRARNRGWRNVAAAGAFVAHHGGVSFGSARQHLLERNTRLLERLHPGYAALIADWQRRDPLGPARRAMDALQWQSARWKSAVILVTHAGGGGVDRVIAARAASFREQGVRPVILRPDAGAVVIGDGDTPNLRYTMPGEWQTMLRFLRASRPVHVELHHMLGHAPEMLDLAPALAIPHQVFVHDYAWFCPRIALVPQHAYCGEPDIPVCEACVADYGNNLEEDIPVADLVRRSAALLGAASRVVTSAADGAVRMRRHFPGLRPDIAPWEDDGEILPPSRPTPGSAVRVCVIGGIGVEKGFEILLGCVRDAAARRLPISFTVVGYTADDARLLDAGPVFITGRYDDDEAGALIAAQRADLALLPSIWPETWSFTLSEAWRAGLCAAVFDIGAPAERVRRTGWGWVLPLGLPPASINDWLLRECTLINAIRPAVQKTPSQKPANPVN